MLPENGIVCFKHSTFRNVTVQWLVRSTIDTVQGGPPFRKNLTHHQVFRKFIQYTTFG